MSFDKEITKALEGYTAKHSHYETERNYISLSNCALTVDELVAQYQKGFPDTLPIRLKCYKGYQMEADLRFRLSETYPDRIYESDELGEISAFNGLVKGHPDFWFMDDILKETFCPGDCKSVLMDEWLPDHRLPRKVYWQMQGYMKYSGKEKSLVVYESRESGLLRAFWIYENYPVQEGIDRKLNEVIKRIKNS